MHKASAQWRGRTGVAGRTGSHPIAVWAIKHLVSPLDRFVVKAFRGRLAPPSSLAVPTLLLTTVGRRSGLARTIPLIYISEGDAFFVANARPAGERQNPWVLNLRASGRGLVKLRGRSVAVTARELDDAEAGRWWPPFVEAWPAFATHYAATGERTVFALERDE
ncbi:MAG: nitroreductase family deazaflavin-dependent oxidoreductase [Acidimicrobiia bacterium]|nr:nitroreductase family deazaflavin-dependent oxidoreductase [Acidimicrobiia bacterium]